MSLTKNKIIQDFVTKNIQTHENKFDCLMNEIEKHIEGAVAHNMVELKEKANNKKKKGDLFECFCFLYLQHVLNHDQVWFYKDFPKELKDQFHLTKNDYGIDLLSKKDNHYYAIQCKYKKPQDKIQIVSWRSLSTFYAIVVKTGPWLKHITMTNVNGCKHIGEKGEKDWSICLGTFRNIDHFTWLKISDTNIPVTSVSDSETDELVVVGIVPTDQRLSAPQSTQITFGDQVGDPLRGSLTEGAQGLRPPLGVSDTLPITKTKKKVIQKLPDKEILRNKRLQYYDQTR
jgi:hypothetical protein